MQFKLKTKWKNKSPSYTNLCIPTRPPFTPFFCHSAFSLSAPFVPPFFFPAHPKRLLLQPESLILCVSVRGVFFGKPCWTHRVLRWNNKVWALEFHSTLFSSGSSCCIVCWSVCRCVPSNNYLKFWSLLSVCFTVHKELKDLNVIKVVSSRGHRRLSGWIVWL